MLNVRPVGWGGGYEGKKKFVYLKWASHFWLSIQNFIFARGKFFAFGWGGVDPPDPPPPPPLPLVCICLCFN